LDRPIENALKIGENWVKYEMHYRILTLNELDRSFPPADDRTKFHQIRFKLETAGAMTDTQIDASDQLLQLDR